MTTFADNPNRSEPGNRQRQNSWRETIAPEARPLLQPSAHSEASRPTAGTSKRFFSVAIFGAMICAVLLMDAIMPLHTLGESFHESLLNQIGSWSLTPSLVLFPGWPVQIPAFHHFYSRSAPHIDLLTSWVTLALLLGSFAALFSIYLFALRHLPARVSRRFVMNSTLVLGMLFLLIPVVTSSDIYSYIAYARIGVIHGLNPLATTPYAISHDPIYGYVSWKTQPSAYGPTWTLITSFFQSMLVFCGLGPYLLPMVLSLRLWGLAMHISSVCLVWSIGGSLQQLHGIVSARKRMLATLAFAWNPLLLLEACTNAHNDTTLLLLVLLAVWFLVRAQLGIEVPTSTSLVGRLIARLNPAARSRLLFLAPTILLALGTCLKINLVMLVPGLFFYQWLQGIGQPAAHRLKHVGISIAVYLAVIVALYAPFWQGGAILIVLQKNPSTTRSINTLPYTFSHLFDGLAASLGAKPALPIGSPAELFFHTLSMGLFVLLYLGLCWQALRSPGSMRRIHGLVRWMAITWLFYCSVGSPWFWPWYMVTFFGLYALVEVSKPARDYIDVDFRAQDDNQVGITHLFKRVQDTLLQPKVIRLLTFSMLTVYGFATWGPNHVDALPGFHLSYLTGALAWLLPLFGLLLASKSENLKQIDLAPVEVLK